MNVPRLLRHRRAPRGVALVVVLAFVVLLTGLIVAYFSRSLTGRQLSSNSAGQMRSGLLAQSAADTIIAGFKQEIKNGSTIPSPAVPNATPANLYLPTTNANAVPVRYPAPASNSTPAPNPTPVPSPAPVLGLIPNLVRESLHGDTDNKVLPSPAVPSYASDLSTSARPAVDGRTVSTARWNSHFLIPTNSKAGVTDPEPNVSFTAPDWVLVTRGGPAVQTAVNSGSGALNDATPTNGNFVVGRYAYAVYDEGGLLDMNVAGHPAPGPSPAQTGFTTAQAGRKGSQALADLTQLPLKKDPSSASDYLPQSMVDSIVGWRNNASAGLNGASYPNFVFSSTQVGNWFKYFVTDNQSGYLKVYGGAANNNGATDQAFLSRQQLLKLRASLGFSANVLQYMGTFSRGLEQPSYALDADRPTIITKNYDLYNFPKDTPPVTDPNPQNAAPRPPSPQYNDNYYGNNDAVGADDPSNNNPINTDFFRLRAQSAFIRQDVDKTPAVAGEPLVKRKFALSRLAEIRYDATNTTASITDPKAPARTNHIYDWFGLKRDLTTDPWKYDHGSTHIMTLTEVAKADREPDFAELLKAAINTGSLGKAGPNLHNDQGNYQYALDVSVDYQVLEIMANLIDQYDADSYPTVIKVDLPSPVGAVTRTVRGVEDLPYFYRYHTMGVMTKVPAPLATTLDQVDFYSYVASSDPPSNASHRGALVATAYHCKPNTTTSNKGEGAMLFIPSLWNPHDATQSNGTSPGPRPARFRVTAVTDDPLGQAPWNTYAKVAFDVSYPQGAPGGIANEIPDTSSPNYVNPPKAPLTKDSSAMIFSDNNGKLFREPTMLWHASAPTNVGLSMPAHTDGFADANFASLGKSLVYYGVCMGTSDLSFSQTISSLSGGTPKYVAVDHNNSTTNLDPTTPFLFQSKTIFYGKDFQASSNRYDQLTFRLEYADPSDSTGNTWVVYDEKYPDFHAIGNPVLAVNANDKDKDKDNKIFDVWPRAKWANPVRGGQLASFNNVIDPRTARFGVGTSSSSDGVYTLEPTASGNFNTDDEGGNKSFGQSNFSVTQTQRPAMTFGQYTNYSNPGMTSDPGRNLQMRWFSGVGFSASNGDDAGQVSPREYDGLFALNNPSISTTARGNPSVPAPLFYEDADGIARRAMGAYVDTAATAAIPFGQPLYTANNAYTDAGTGTPFFPNYNRPVILNRAFRSVAEMGYAFRGTPWKQLDFFTPESGDAALLDVFCVNEPPADGIVAGKVNLNTRQVPVLKALLVGTTRDEARNVAGLPATFTYPMADLDAKEAEAIANRLVGLTTDGSAAWRGPLVNIAHLVGRYVANPGNTSGVTDDPDFYKFKEPASGTTYLYAGFSAALGKVNDASSVTNAKNATPRIQRFRESAIRALADAGQTRVWNLLIDVVAQTGRYGPNAQRLDQFSVDGEQRCWVHVAIDRLTGEVIDKQVEVVTE